MNWDRLFETAAIAVGIAYLALFGWAITNTTFDVWGVLVVTPVLSFLVVLLIRRMFDDHLVGLRNVLYAGLIAKLLGTALRYWVGFEAYGGGIDAARYHRFGVTQIAARQDGLLSFWDLLPTGTGTPFVEDVVAVTYAIMGPTQMGGFVLFGIFGYVGVLCFVKAAAIAIPGLATMRYAVLCALAPSLAYWPSSIGKEALMMLGLGIATLGVAKFFATGAIAGPLLITVAGLAFTSGVRPHMAAMWAAGIFPALLVKFVHNLRAPATVEGRRTNQALMFVVIGVAAIGLVVLASATVRYLPGADDASGDGARSIVEETQRRTSQARSSFDPPNVNNPVNWPYAIVRTLTRPLIVEARGSAQLFTAAELTILIGIALVSWRRLAHLPKLVLTVPFVTFSMTTLALGGLAFSSFANLGILARQKALVFPFMLLLLCLPELPRRTEHDPEGERARRRQELDEHRFLSDQLRPVAPSVAPDVPGQNNSMSPSVSAQLGNGGMPGSFTARHVSIGPPPGNGAHPDDDLFAPRRMA